MHETVEAPEMSPKALMSTYEHSLQTAPCKATRLPLTLGALT